MWMAVTRCWEGNFRNSHTHHVEATSGHTAGQREANCIAINLNSLGTVMALNSIVRAILHPQSTLASVPNRTKYKKTQWILSLNTTVCDNSTPSIQRHHWHSQAVQYVSTKEHKQFNVPQQSLHLLLLYYLWHYVVPEYHEQQRLSTPNPRDNIDIHSKKMSISQFIDWNIQINSLMPTRFNKNNPLFCENASNK